MAVYASACVGLLLPELGARTTLTWLPNGVAAALLFLWGVRLWPAVLIAVSLLAATFGFRLVVAVPSALGGVLAAVACVLILRGLRFDSRFSRVADLLALLVAAGVSQALFASGGTLGRVLGPGLAIADWPVIWAMWWRLFLGSFGGLLVILPLIVTFARVRAPLARRRREALAWAAGLAVGGAAILVVDVPEYVYTLAIVSQLLVVWAVSRFDPRWTASAVFLVTTCAGLAYAFDVGAFAPVANPFGYTLLWVFVGTLASLAWLLTGLFGERDDADRRYRVLFDRNPHPLWLQDDADGRILMVNDAALALYGWSRAELVGRRAATLGFQADVAGDPRSRFGAYVPEAAVHRRRDGAALDVELHQHALELDGRPLRLVFAIDVTERRRLQSAVLDATDRERERLGVDLHDGLGQELAGLAMLAQGAQRRLSREAAGAGDEDLRSIVQVAQLAMESCRRIARGLSPLSDLHGGLAGALRELAGRADEGATARVTFAAEGALPPHLPPCAADHLYRIAQEALNNALKHSGARHVRLLLVAAETSVQVEIVDDGCGLPTGAASGGRGLGLATLRYRAATINARLAIDSSSSGTRVSCLYPLPAESRAADARRAAEGRLAGAA